MLQEVSYVIKEYGGGELIQDIWEVQHIEWLYLILFIRLLHRMKYIKLYYKHMKLRNFS